MIGLIIGLVLGASLGVILGGSLAHGKCADCQREMMAAIMAAQDVAREAMQAQK